MTVLSTAAWTAHEIGLATAVGGSMFGRTALQPALQRIEDPENRDCVSSDAWRRFSWLNLAAHGVSAATWFASRPLLGSRRVGLTRIKDGLVIASLATAIASVVLGRVLRRDMLDKGGPEGNGENVIAAANRASRGRQTMRRVVQGVGIANLLANAANLGITVLALDGRR